MITYKVATREDIETIIQFRLMQLSRNGSVNVEGFEEDLYRFFNACFDQQRIHQIFAYDGEDIVATGAVLFYDYPPSHVNTSGKIAYISNMFTQPHYRRQGIASAILILLEEEARKRGITTAKLGATPMGKSIYEHAGYKEDELYTLIKKL